MGHRFKARDKTVKKMSRDGLVEKSLDSREPGAADLNGTNVRMRRGWAGKADEKSDSRGRRSNGKAGNGKKRRTGIRVECPDQGAVRNTDTTFTLKEKQDALTGTSQEIPDSRTADIPSTCQRGFMGSVNRTDSVREGMGCGNSHMESRRGRHSVSAERAVMISRKENSREPESQRRDVFRASECREKSDGGFNEKDRRQFSDMPENGRQGADGLRHMPRQHFQSGNNKMELCPPSESGDRPEPEYRPACDSADKGLNPDADGRLSGHHLCMEHVRRQPTRGTGFVKAAAAAGAVHGRKIKNEPDNSGRRKRNPVYSKKEAVRPDAWEKQSRDGGVGTHDSTDMQKEDHDKPERFSVSGRENHRQKNYYHNRRYVLGMPSAGTGGGKTAEAQSGVFSARNKENVQEQGSGRGHKPQRGSRECVKADIRTDVKQGSKESPKQGQDASLLKNGKRLERTQTRVGKKKKVSRLSFDDEGSRMVCGRDMGIAKRAVLTAATAGAQSGRVGGQEQEDAAVHGIKNTARSAAYRTMRASVWKKRSVSSRQRRRSILDSSMRRKSLRHGEPPESGKKPPDQHGSEKARQKKKAEKRAWQKRMIRKSYQAQKRREPAAEPSMPVISVRKPFAGDSIFKAGRRPVKTALERKGVAAAIVFFVLLAVTVSAGMSSCGAVLQGASSSIVGTTYISEDADIYAAEADYAALENALDSQVNDIEDAHPGFDEYRYQVDEISHNPYHLISCLTAAYGGFTYEQVKDELPVLFDIQYRLTVEEIVEMRTRTETGADTGEETEVEYEWRVLCIRLENRGIDGAAEDFLTAEQAEHYAAYNATKGNRDYLFDAESIPSGGTSSGMQPDSGIPDEALSDVQFANMIREAEKFLGYPYVWGGSSPQTSFDCSGFVSWVVNNCGNGWNVGRQTAEGLRGCCTYVPPADAKPGDLIFFQGTYDTAGASHVGIYVGDNRMIHCGNPVQYANTNTAYWQQHFLSFGRLP